MHEFQSFIFIFGLSFGHCRYCFEATPDCQMSPFLQFFGFMYSTAREVWTQILELQRVLFLCVCNLKQEFLLCYSRFYVRAFSK